MADAQALPFPDASFDVVTSTFGAMFAPDQEATAAELVRVVRPGGRIGMANWIPDGWVAARYAMQVKYAPAPPPGTGMPAAWGTAERVHELFDDQVSDLVTTVRVADFIHESAASMYELFKEWFGPVASLVARLDAEQEEEFKREWITLAEESNIATDGTCEIPSPYVEVVAVTCS